MQAIIWDILGTLVGEQGYETGGRRQPVEGTLLSKLLEWRLELSLTRELEPV